VAARRQRFNIIIIILLKYNVHISTTRIMSSHYSPSYQHPHYCTSPWCLLWVPTYLYTNNNCGSISKYSHDCWIHNIMIKSQFKQLQHNLMYACIWIEGRLVQNIIYYHNYRQWTSEQYKSVQLLIFLISYFHFLKIIDLVIFSQIKYFKFNYKLYYKIIICKR